VSGAPRIAYLTGRYPAISHTFVLREVEALRALGVDIASFSIWRTEPGELLAQADRAEQARTFALLPPSLRAYARAHLLALRLRAGAYLRHLPDALRLGPPGVRGKLLACSWFLESVVLWYECRRRDIRHIHVHLNGTAPAVAMLAARLANHVSGERDQTWSMTVHGPAEFYDVKGERLAAKVRDASFVVCISDFARSQVMTLVDETEWDKLFVIHCGVPRDAFLSRAPEGNGREASILSVGRLASAKGQAVLVDAVAELAARNVPARLKLVGDGPKRPVLERLIADRGVASRFELVGAVGADEILGYYANADVFCLSSLAEGVPVVLMEAMAAGLPVVAPRIMGISELVEDGVSGLLVAPGRPDQLASALERLVADPELRAQLGQSGREKVAAEFGLERSAGQLRDLFVSTASSD
jgi:glycosyltransferase involved in cell wall biosynthesis